MKVYCVFKEEIVQMCYETQVLDKVFKTKEAAQAYVNERKKYSDYDYDIEEMEVEG